MVTLLKAINKTQIKEALRCTVMDLTSYHAIIFRERYHCQKISKYRKSIEFISWGIDRYRYFASIDGIEVSKVREPISSFISCMYWQYWDGSMKMGKHTRRRFFILRWLAIGKITIENVTWEHSGLFLFFRSTWSKIVHSLCWSFLWRIVRVHCSRNFLVTAKWRRTCLCFSYFFFFF